MVLAIRFYDGSVLDFLVPFWDFILLDVSLAVASLINFSRLWINSHSIAAAAKCFSLKRNFPSHYVKSQLHGRDESPLAKRCTGAVESVAVCLLRRALVP